MTPEPEDPRRDAPNLPDTFVDADTFQDRLQAAREAQTERLWPEGHVSECPRCGEETFRGRNDLTARLTSGHHVISYRHLHGAQCTACGAQTLEPYEQIGIEDEAGVGFHPDYEAKVSRIGSGTLGTYWPKDVQRVLGLKPHEQAFIEIIDQDAVLIRFQDPDP